jgi:CBS domain-containing protein
MTVGHLMTKEVATCLPYHTLRDAVRVMLEGDFGSVPVTEGDGSKRLVGIVTDRDVCLAAFAQNKPLDEIPVAAAMSRDVRSCSPDDPLSIAETIMSSAQVRRVPVLDRDGELCGIVTLGDLALAARKGEKAPVTSNELSRTLASISLPPQG